MCIRGSQALNYPITKFSFRLVCDREIRGGAVLPRCYGSISLYNDSSPNLRRRDGRVAEGARLESVFRGNSNVGSNPTLSAILYVIDLIMLILAEEIKVTLSTSYLYFQ